MIPNYSLFFEDLKSRGHILSFHRVDTTDLELKSFGVNNFDNILFFAPNVDKLGSVSFEDILEFLNEGGNILIALNRDVSESVRDFVETFGISLDKRGTEVIDHFETEPSIDIRYLSL